MAKPGIELHKVSVSPVHNTVTCYIMYIIIPPDQKAKDKRRKEKVKINKLQNTRINIAFYLGVRLRNLC